MYRSQRTLSLSLFAMILPGLAFAAPATPPPAKPAATAPAKSVGAPAVPAGVAAPQASASVSGNVAKPDGTPIAGAIVRILPKIDRGGAPGRRGRPAPMPTVVKTKEDGTFASPKLEGSTFILRVEAAGLAPFRADDVPAGASLRVKLKAGAPFSGRVLDQGSKEPVAGATVVAYDAGAEGFGEEAAIRSVIGEDGRFTIPNLPSGEATIEAFSPRHARGRLDRPNLAAGTTAEPILWLRPGGRLAGSVSGVDGKPLPGIEVTLRPAEGGLLSRIAFEAPRIVRTDPAGAFAFDGVAAGKRWKAVARGEGFGEGESAAVLVERGTDRGDLAIRLEASASIAFKVVDREGKPVRDAQISVEPSEKEPRGRGRGPRFGAAAVDEDRMETKADGGVVVRGFDPGLVDVTIMPETGADIEKEGVRLRAGETLDLGTLRLAEGKTISGHIFDKNGEPVAKAEVSAFWLGGDRPKFRSVKSKSDGRYVLGGLGDQPLRSLSVRAKGFAPAENSSAAPGDVNVDFTLERTASIVGKVLDADGRVPPSFEVKAHPEAQAQSQNARGMFNFRRVVGGQEKPFTDPSGIFKVEDVAPGTVTVEARAAGWAAKRKTGVRVAAEEVVDVGTIVLEPGRALRGRVLDVKDDTPLAGASVAVHASQGTAIMRFGGADDDAISAISGADGAFAVDGLEGKTYVLSVGHPDFAANESTVEVPSDRDPAEMTVRLGRGGTLAGVVRDAARQPIANANIIAIQGNFGGEPNSAATGPDGRYAIERLAPGSYNVTRVPDSNRILVGFGMKQAAIREGETTTVDFDESSKHNVSGRVLRAGKPVPNLGMLFLAGDGSGLGASAKSVESDGEGRYEVGLDAPGPYSVILRGAGGLGSGAPLRIEVPDAPTAKIDITLRTQAITGRVRDQDGKPVRGAYVSARQDGVATPVRGGGTESDAEGRFTIEGVEAGTYRVTALANGFATAEVYPVAVTENTAAPDVDIRLESGRTIRGRVVDPRGNGVAGALVVAAEAGTTRSSGLPASTDVNGTFAVNVGTTGSWDLAAIASGRAPGRASGVLPSDDPEASVVTVVLGTGGRLRVVVAGSDGEPVAGANVTIAASPPYLGSDMMGFLNRPTPTGPDGASLIAALAPGSYQVSAQMGTRIVRGQVVVPEDGEAALALVLP